MPNAIITLTTDYGTNDHLVGTLKGVILKINPEVTIVDITHNVAAYDLLDGALAIGSAFAYFPPRTIHVVIVDPGVGTERRPLLVTGDNQYFVAPDNGVLSLVYERDPSVVVRHVGARTVLDLNLVTDLPRMAAQWARAAEEQLPAGSITG